MAVLFAPALQTLYSPDFEPSHWTEAPFDFFALSFPGFYDGLARSVSSDWRLGGDAKPLDFDLRLNAPTLNYDPYSVVCKLLGDEHGAKSGRTRESVSEPSENRHVRCLGTEELDQVI